MRYGRARTFCEACGFNSSVGGGDRPPSMPWLAVVSASRACFESVIAAGGPGASEVQFPVDFTERTIPLSGSRLRIGRRSMSREVTPEIDLTGPPADPGISRLHATLTAQPDGAWAITDSGSENGTMVNATEIAPGQLVPLADGDVICIGAWTAITILAPT
jgi:pSer/pThr/pTyr-binding forkhead associated (FHA) protein